jgi:hypothetical protein
VCACVCVCVCVCRLPKSNCPALKSAAKEDGEGGKVNSGRWVYRGSIVSLVMSKALNR